MVVRILEEVYLEFLITIVRMITVRTIAQWSSLEEVICTESDKAIVIHTGTVFKVILVVILKQTNRVRPTHKNPIVVQVNFFFFIFEEQTSMKATRELSPPMNICNPREVTSALPLSYVGVGLSDGWGNVLRERE
ncbi:hypothetical protein EVAR_33861_1 [Eumeta japonica]|uniref:Uncharacterized protein n=1 Tax=Eumeta variegata TaxID=151549 RepID=A0A4C1X469_EUMVA|nr:hypothetical protein EVAR_33861_1 [Eumeta japonica]